MRIRAVLIAIAAALALAACGGQSGSAGEQAPTEAPRLKGLRVEVDAQMQDPCARKPTELAPADCQKYITQLTSTPESAEQVARSDPALARAAQRLREGITAYRAGSCAGVTGESRKCTQALVDVADALRAIHKAVESGTG